MNIFLDRGRSFSHITLVKHNMGIVQFFKLAVLCSVLTINASDQIVKILGNMEPCCPHLF